MSRLVSLYGLALTGLEARVGLVDHVEAALAAHDLAIAVTVLERPERAANFHCGLPEKAKAPRTGPKNLWGI